MKDLTTVLRTSRSQPSEARRGTNQRREGSRLKGHVRRVEELTLTERDQMHALMVRYFANVTRPRFEHDLAEKEWVILLADASAGQIQGFSTLLRLDTVVDDQPVVAFFSGDTIIHRDYWGEAELPRVWGRHVFSLAAYIFNARIYWFLICSGYKTYRFMPRFFRTFYPRYQRPIPPAIKRVMDALAYLKFPSEYDSESGVIRPAEPTPVRPGVAEVTERHLENPHIAFFVDANPGHVQGDELVCLAELTPANLTDAGRQVLGLPPR